MSKVKNTDWFIVKSKTIHGIKYDYSASKYLNAKEKIQIKCIKHDSIFFQRSNDHFKSKFPCKICATENKRSLFSDGINGFIKKMVLKHGDVFSYKNSKYHNARTKIIIICKKCSYKIESEPYVLINGKGCPKCFQKKTKNSFSLNKLLEINRYVKKFGGKCLSNNYYNNEENLKFECKKGHVFFESWSDVKHSLRWCKECAPNRYIGETLTRMILEHLLDTKMPSSYIKSMGGLQLDGYCKVNNIAFEYQGYQHFTKESYFYKSKKQFESQKARDSQKKISCKKKGIKLVEIYEFKTIRKSRIPIFVNQVKTQLDNLNIKYTSIPFIPNLERLYRRRESTLYALAKKIVESNHAVIQTYVGSESNHIITCKSGHKINKKLSVIKKNGFNCQKCKNQSKYIKLKQIVESKGGRLLDVKISGCLLRNNINWECDKGHKNFTKGQGLKNGVWCKRCSIQDRSIKVDKDKFIQIAADNNLTTSEKLKVLAIESSKFYSLLKKHKVVNKHKSQDRSKQDLSKKSKGKIFQLDPTTLEIIKKYKYLEATRKDSNGKFSPEGIRIQMKKNKKAYGYYWIRENEYENILTKKANNKLK
tara:strand:- start:54 stop:1826 length:1773 start_codon:yes stop_codon:yes gene_type:complete